MILSVVVAHQSSLWSWLLLSVIGFVALTDLMRPLTVDEVRQSIYNVLAAVGVNTTTWKPGSVVRTMIAACAIIIASLSKLIALVARGGFLETAVGSWLTLVARYVFGVERELATFAPGEVTLVNAGGGIYDIDPDDLILSNPDTGKTYRNTTAFTLNALSTLTIPIVAIEAGADSTAVPGAISAMETPLLGVTVSNAGAVVGQDEEGDAALKTRCAEKLGSLSPNGPWDAYTYVARRARRADGSLIGVTRVRTRPDGVGGVFVYLATATGPVTGTAGDPATDLGAISLELQRKSVPLAITANALAATPLVIPITYSVWMYNSSGRSEQEIRDAIALALAEYMGSRPIGGHVISGTGNVYLSDLLGVIRGVFPSDIFRVVIAAPAADVVIASGAVPVLGTVTATVTQVPVNGGL